MSPEENQTETVEQQEDETTETVELSVEDLKKQVDELTRHAKNKEEEAARVQKKLKAFEDAETARKQAEMSEVEKANAKAKAAEEEREKLAKEYQALKLQRDFETRVRDAKLEFRNPLAAKDAFNAMVELLDGEAEINDDLFKQLTKERDYLFGKVDASSQNNDAKSKGKSNANILSEEQIAKKKRSFTPL